MSNRVFPRTISSTLAFAMLCYETEERAGHHVKLHEYCSTDVDNMVQRHIHVRTPTLLLDQLRPRTLHCSAYVSFLLLDACMLTVIDSPISAVQW